MTRRIPLAIAFIFIAAISFLPVSSFAQDSILEISLSLPEGFDPLANGAQPGISCTLEVAPYSVVTANIVLNKDGIYLAELSVAPDSSYVCMLSEAIDGLYSNERLYLHSQAGETTKDTLTLSALDADVTIELLSMDAGTPTPFHTPANAPEAIAFCIDSDFEESFSKHLNAGDESVKIYLPGGKNYYCQIAQIDNYGSEMQLLTVGLNAHITTQIQMVPFDATATIHIVDQDNQPIVSSLPIYVYCYTKELQFSFPPIFIQPGDSQGNIRLSSAHSYTCSSMTNIPLYASTSSTSFYLPTGDSPTDANITLSALEEHLIIGLSESSGDPYIVPESESVYVNCLGDNFLSFSQAITSGESTTDIALMHGDYQCSSYVAGKAVASGKVSIAAHSTATLALQIVEKNATAHIFLQDTNGSAMTDLPDISFSAWPKEEGLADWAYGPLSAGQANINIAPQTTYLVMVSNSVGGCGKTVTSSQQKEYFLKCGTSEIEAAASETKDFPITVYQSDARLRVSVFDAHGAPMDGVFVMAIEKKQSAADNSPLMSYANTDTDGIATIPVVSGKTFQVSVLSSGSQAGMQPATVEATLAAEETKSISLSYQAIDFWLSINSQMQSIDHGIFYCYAYDNAGHISTSEYGIPIGQTFILPLLSTSSWHIGCSGANESVYFSSDEFLYQPPAGQTTDSITIGEAVTNPLNRFISRLENSPSFHIDGASFSYSANISSQSATSLTANTNTELRVPASTFNTQQGSISISVDNATGLVSSSENEPIRSSAISLSASDSNGPNLSLAQGKSFSIILSINRTQIENCSPDSIVGAHYDRESSTYSVVPTTLEEADNGDTLRYTLNASQTGIFVLLRPKECLTYATPTPTPSPSATTTPQPTPKATAPGTPSKIKLKLGKGNLLISWTVSKTGDAATSFKLSISSGKRTLLKTTLKANARAYNWKRKMLAGSYKLQLVAVNKTGRSAPASKSFRLVEHDRKLTLK